MEKTLVTLECGCTYNTWDNCTGDNTYCETHTAENEARRIARETDIANNEAKAQLRELDIQSIRSIRAKIAGTATSFDDAKLAGLDAQAVELRKRIK